MSAQGDTAARDAYTGSGTTGNTPPDPTQVPAAPDNAEGAAADHVDNAAVDAVAAPGEAAGGIELAGPLLWLGCEPIQDL